MRTPLLRPLLRLFGGVLGDRAAAARRGKGLCGCGWFSDGGRTPDNDDKLWARAKGGEDIAMLARSVRGRSLLVCWVSTTSSALFTTSLPQHPCKEAHVQRLPTPHHGGANAQCNTHPPLARESPHLLQQRHLRDGGHAKAETAQARH